MNNSNGKTRRLAGLALFTAIVVVLQLLGSFIKVGPFAVSLVLIPIVVGAAVYGVSAGAWLGFVFGVVVTIAVVTGADAGGYIMFSARPVMTVLVCLIKGTAAGYVAGLLYRAIGKKHPLAGVIVAAALPPRARSCSSSRPRAGRQHRAVRARHGAVLSAAAAGMGRRHGCGNVCRYGSRGREFPARAGREPRPEPDHHPADRGRQERPGGLICCWLWTLAIRIL